MARDVPKFLWAGGQHEQKKKKVYFLLVERGMIRAKPARKTNEKDPPWKEKKEKSYRGKNSPFRARIRMH